MAQLSAVAQIEFDALVKAAYQSAGVIPLNSVRVKSNVVGEFTDFRTKESIISTDLGFGDAVTPQDGGFDKETARLLKKVASASTDKVEDLTVNFDSKMELADLVGKAMGRRRDQTILDALTAATLPAENIIGPNTTGLTYEKVIRANERLDDLAVPPNERTFLLSARAQSYAFNIAQFTDNDFSNVGEGGNRIRSGSFNNSMSLSFMWRIIPAMAEGGLPKTGNIRSLFVYDKMAVGLALGMDQMTSISYENKNLSWLINGVQFLGGVVIDPKGVIRIDIDESVAI